MTLSTGLIDIGVNLTNKRFNKDLDQVIQRAQAAGVVQCIVTGTSLQESERALALCLDYPDFFKCTAGVHPHEAKNWNSDTERSIRELASHDAVVAIGECGLDFNRNFSPPKDQEAAFEAQLQIAVDTGLPLFLHERDAFERQSAILKGFRDCICAGVSHCFTGEKKALFGYLDLDLHIGQTGWICDERRGVHLRELVKNIPANRLMLETDAPYLFPRDMPNPPKDKRNAPEFLPYIAEQIAAYRGEPVEQLVQATFETTVQFFSL